MGAVIETGTKVFRVRVEGLDDLLRKLKSPGVHVTIFRRALREAAKLVTSILRGRAPYDSGYLKAHITHKLDTRRVPRFAVISMDWRPSKSGARYPWILDVGRRGGRRPAVFARTKHWITGTVEITRERVNGIIAGAASEIEAAWRR